MQGPKSPNTKGLVQVFWPRLRARAPFTFALAHAPPCHIAPFKHRGDWLPIQRMPLLWAPPCTACSDRTCLYVATLPSAGVDLATASTAANSLARGFQTLPRRQVHETKRGGGGHWVGDKGGGVGSEDCARTLGEVTVPKSTPHFGTLITEYHVLQCQNVPRKISVPFR